MNNEVNQVNLADIGVTEDDYAFVVSADGKLKAVILPADLPFAAPKNIQKILKIFNIADVEQASSDVTLH